MDNKLINRLMNIYNIMLKEYGVQGWWPVTAIGGCKNEISPKPIYGIALTNEKQKHEIIFGAILTQNTSWKNVEKAIVCMNENQLNDIDAIIKSNQEKLAQCIKSSGYHNQKAERLKIICEFLKENSIEKLQTFKLSDLRTILLNIKGIGPETCDSIILYALDMPVFVIDAYTKRIMSRIGLCTDNSSYDELQSLFMKNLPNETKLFNEYHALLVEHAKRFCKTKPECSECILKKECEKIF